MIGQFNKIKISHIFWLAFFVRLLWYFLILIFNSPGFWLYDSNGYWNIAYNLNEYGAFSQSENYPILPDYYRTPIYPFFIYPTILFDSTGNSIPLLQIGINLLNIYIIYRILKLYKVNLFHIKITLLFFAFGINQLVFTNYVLSEVLLQCLCSLTVYFTIRYFKNIGNFNILYASVFFSLSVLCKPIVSVFFVPFIIILLFKKNMSFFKKIKRSIFAYLIVAIICSIWIYRNKKTFNESFISVIGEHALLNHHAAFTIAHKYNLNYFTTATNLRQNVFSTFKGNAYNQPYAYAQHIKKIAVDTIATNFTDYLPIHLQQFFYFLIKPCGKYFTYQFNIRSPVLYWVVVAFQFIYYGFIYIVILIASFKLIKNNVFIILSGLYLLAAQIHLPPYTDARLRMPFEFLLFIIFALSLQQLVKIKNTH